MTDLCCPHIVRLPAQLATKRMVEKTANAILQIELQGIRYKTLYHWEGERIESVWVQQCFAWQSDGILVYMEVSLWIYRHQQPLKMERKNYTYHMRLSDSLWLADIAWIYILQRQSRFSFQNQASVNCLAILLLFGGQIWQSSAPGIQMVGEYSAPTPTPLIIYLFIFPIHSIYTENTKNINCKVVLHTMCNKYSQWTTYGTAT